MCRWRSLDEMYPVHRAATWPEGLRHGREDICEDRGSEVSIASHIAAVLIQDGKVLFVETAPHRKVYPAVWDLPGGHSEGEESPENALRREAREELGIEIESFRLLGQVHDPVEPSEITVSAVTTWKGKPVNASPDEHTRITWFAPDGLPDSTALDLHRLVKCADSTQRFR